MTIDLQQLTKKNQEFIHIATNELMANGKTDEEIKTILEEVLPQILEEQGRGIPARTFLGAPTRWAQSYSQKEAQVAATATNDNPWLMFLDSSLFFLGFIALFSGVMNFFDSRTTSYGLISLFVFGFSGGALLYFMYRFQTNLAQNRKRFGWLKSILALIPVLIVLVIIVTLSGLIPATINIQLPAFVTILIGAAAIGGKYLFKKHFNIQSSFTPKAN